MLGLINLPFSKSQKCFKNQKLKKDLAAQPHDDGLLPPCPMAAGS
jgi:hypothetical protein